ncbi:Qat anti-phage system QueC-like protein QatC [Methylopila sp. M107]|uniref:Qat anti-phage system QueC-like protein QatC n=1 Tax=Methylopila sp. M107 TaxID=1101190 RepID=UPI00037F31A8|nr:Qat anti-phage system QueC-like protein QatC [Methylopila sp. M107]
MKRHLIVGRLGPTDRGVIPAAVDEVVTRLDLASGDRSLGHGVGRAMLDLSRLHLEPSEVGLDLLVFAAHVHAADTRIARGSDSQDGWTRELRLVVPVADPAIWWGAAPILTRMLNFLTGDRWTLGFRSRPRRFARMAPPRRNRLFDPPFDRLQLFSGGLDSLIGAIDALAAGRTPLLVSHAGEGATSDAQTRLFDALKARFPASAVQRLRLWTAFPDGFVAGTGAENTTRGRSFLFFALGAFAGSALGRDFVLQCPENGLIAINVPLDPVRLGALSTRTTHPFYIARWNQALAALGIPGQIENPYWDQTKGEMVEHCADRGLLAQLAPVSLSCASPSKGRWQGLGTQHCGYCLPCLIRRASLTAGLAPNLDPTTYTIDDLTARPLNTKESEGVQIRSFQLAIARLRRRPDLARLLIHKPGPLFDESADRQAALADVYRRGMLELDSVLARVRTAPQ